MERSSRLPERRVLLVEDDRDIRSALTEVLVEEGYQVTGVGNGQEAMQHLRQRERPWVILLDLMMPVMNGWQFLALQREDPSLAEIPVVVISAAGVSKQGLGGVAAALIPKPIPLDVLLGALARLCRTAGDEEVGPLGAAPPGPPSSRTGTRSPAEQPAA